MMVSNKRLVSVGIAISVPEILIAILIKEVELSTNETHETEIKRYEDAVTFYMRVLCNYDQDEAFREALDREFLNASTQKWTMEGIKEGTASLNDYARALMGFDHPVMDECRKGLVLPFHVSKEEKESEKCESKG